MLRIFKNTKFDFLRHSKTAIICSSLFIAASIVALVVHGGFNVSIDFAGGTTAQIKFEQPVRDDLNTIRSAVAALGFGAPEIKTIGLADNNELQITVRDQAAKDASVIDEMQAALTNALPNNGFTVLRVENVGPKIGGELTRDAIIASVIALIAILFYIGVRFKLSYAVALIIPLAHNALITIGVFAIFNLELSLTFIAAILTVIGYSLNDSIVVFDRVRENLKGGLRGKTVFETINASVNQTLSRTIITSVTTLFTVAALFVLGSDSIRYFALALAVGIIVGTYSTIYIASFILLKWHQKWAIAK